MNSFLFALAIFVSVWWTSINTAKLIRGALIPVWNFVIMSAGITAVITKCIGLW